MLRAQLLQLIRKLGLSHALDLLRYRTEQLRNSAINRTFKRNNPAFVLPPDYLIYESFHLNYAAYQRTGLEAAQWLYTYFTDHAENQPTGTTVLDWGCGPGRILRHLPEVFGPHGQYIGVDPNKNSIDWCREHLANPSIGNLSVHQSQLQPPLPLTPESIDFLYGISILTHLSEAAHTAWMIELMRVLRPGGVALLTTHGPAYKVKLTNQEQARFEQNEFVIRGQVQEGHRVFTAYHPPKKMRELFAPHAEVVAYVAGQPKSWGIDQDVWVIKKKAKA